MSQRQTKLTAYDPGTPSTTTKRDTDVRNITTITIPFTAFKDAWRDFEWPADHGDENTRLRVSPPFEAVEEARVTNDEDTGPPNIDIWPRELVDSIVHVDPHDVVDHTPRDPPKNEPEFWKEYWEEIRGRVCNDIHVIAPGDGDGFESITTAVTHRVTVRIIDE